MVIYYNVTGSAMWGPPPLISRVKPRTIVCNPMAHEDKLSTSHRHQMLVMHKKETIHRREYILLKYGLILIYIYCVSLLLLSAIL